MPRRALRCVVDLQLNLVSAPGVWLPCKEDVYLSVSLFSQYRNTRLLTSCFPLLIHEKFRFEKTYYTAVDPAHVADLLADELVIFELVQLSEYSDGAVRLASYSTNARDFLYPYPTLAPSYSAHDREVLMCRTVAFPGISPKLEFATTTLIKESLSVELDALDDALEYEAAVRRSRSRSRTRRALARARKAWEEEKKEEKSLSPTRRKLADVSLEDTAETRPPFVVRKLSDDLIGRKPGEEKTEPAESKPKAAKPTSTASSRALSPVPVLSKPSYKSIVDDLDLEVAALTTPRYRSKSPLTYTRSFLERYGYDPIYDPITLRPYSPYYWSTLTAYERQLAREGRLSRLRSLYPYTYSRYRTLDDLDLDLRLARLRTERALLL